MYRWRDYGEGISGVNVNARQDVQTANGNGHIVGLTKIIDSAASRLRCHVAGRFKEEICILALGRYT